MATPNLPVAPKRMVEQFDADDATIDNVRRAKLIKTSTKLHNRVASAAPGASRAQRLASISIHAQSPASPDASTASINSSAPVVASIAVPWGYTNSFQSTPQTSGPKTRLHDALPLDHVAVAVGQMNAYENMISDPPSMLAHSAAVHQGHYLQHSAQMQHLGSLYNTACEVDYALLQSKDQTFVPFVGIDYEPWLDNPHQTHIPDFPPFDGRGYHAAGQPPPAQVQEACALVENGPSNEFHAPETPSDGLVTGGGGMSSPGMLFKALPSFRHPASTRPGSASHSDKKQPSAAHSKVLPPIRPHVLHDPSGRQSLRPPHTKQMQLTQRVAPRLGQPRLASFSAPRPVFRPQTSRTPRPPPRQPQYLEASGCGISGRKPPGRKGMPRPRKYDFLEETVIIEGVHADASYDDIAIEIGRPVGQAIEQKIRRMITQGELPEP